MQYKVMQFGAGVLIMVHLTTSTSLMYYLLYIKKMYLYFNP